MGVLGPNGCGKTTLFSMCIGEQNPEGGKIYLNNKAIDQIPIHLRSKEGLGYLPQQRSVFDMSVYDNILGIAQISIKDVDQQKAITEKLLDEFNLQHLRTLNASVLSGGEIRRLMMARVMINKPKIVLLDEPLAALDPLVVQDIQKYILKIQSSGTAILVTDHNVKNLFDITDRSYVLGEHTVIAEGTSKRNIKIIKSNRALFWISIFVELMPLKSFNLKIHNQINSFNKTIKVDPDKSLSIRSFLIGSISHDISKVNNILESEDVFSTINCLRKLGVTIKKKKAGSYLIYGKGLGSLFAKKNLDLNFGNSDTLARLLIGILSTTPEIEVKLRGDHSLNKRSMQKLINLMSEFGAYFIPKNKFNFPLKLISTDMPVGINYNAGVSAQLKSAVIFAGLNSFGNTKIFESKRSRDHTENLLARNPQAIKITNVKKN